MKQVLIQGGGVQVQDVPSPLVGPRSILVRVAHSCVSAGTEMASVKMSGLPLYRRALKQPENVKRVLQMAGDQGIQRTLDRIKGQLQSGSPTGYSAAGHVIAVGKEVEGIQLGDRVACAGAGIANHAEVIDVPVNLAVKVPDGLAMEWASTVTLGAIAMQGVRRAVPTLGESVVVIGLGVLGQITAQLLRANGCCVIGIDPDAKRIDLALQNGMDHGINPSVDDSVARVQMLTEGFGADAAIVTAASSSDEVISQAMQVCRKKGRVVLVGDVGLGLRRADFYAKELDFLISSSYGPGRYDPVYEEGGRDYPLPYIRWTENRNMQAYLELLAHGKVTLQNLCGEAVLVEDADAAYQALKDRLGPVITLLAYPPSTSDGERKIVLRAAGAKSTRIRVALVGASSFAQSVHLPNLARLRDRFELHAVVSRTGSKARAVAEQFEASYATTEYERVLEDLDVDLIMICTRHNLHGSMVLQALQAGKHVFVEKPLTLDEADVNAIANFYAANHGPMLMVGYNRRFAPAIVRAREALVERATPLLVNYRMNAGFIPGEHWVQSEEGGGRNMGEACHIYDVFNSLVESGYCAVSAQAVRPSGQWRSNDNFVATVSYNDGSVCTLTYSAMGHKSHPKECMEIFGDGKVISMVDYKQLTVHGGKQSSWTSKTIQKGQPEELEALAHCLQQGGEWPIQLQQLLDASRISLSVEEQVMATRKSDNPLG